MNKLAALGRVVARAEDVARVRRPRDERAAERFVSALRRETRSKRRAWLAAGAAVISAAAIVILVWQRNQFALPNVGQHVIAGAGQTVPLGFPDGSRVLLGSASEAVVHQLGEASAEVELSHGEASVAVRHQQHTRWLVDAGPYRVRVTGTRFSVSWAPERERFELRLDQGSVVVGTASSAHAAVTMLAPETLVIDHGRWQLSAPPLPPPPAAAETKSAGEPTAPAPAEAPTPHAPTLPAPRSWESLVRAGNYRDAYAEAARVGIGQLAEARPSSSLLSLAEVCRFSGHVADATQVLTRLRARFPHSDDAATAAFQLGRLSSDAGGASWFRTYLNERPNGALAQEASGRLLEALSRAGDRVGAERAAEAYLSRYPSGTHAAFARRLLGK